MNFAELKKYNLEEIKSAGPRYTPGQDKDAPNLHIQELEEAFDALSLSADFRERLQNLEKLIAKGLEESSRQIDSLFKGKKRSPLYLKNLITKLSIANPQDARILVREIEAAIKSVNKIIRKREDELFELERKERNRAKEEHKSKETSYKQDNGYDYERHQLRQFESSIGDIRSYFHYVAADLIPNNCLLLLGEWGTGKTHSLCDFVKK